ncbi:MAG: hypothetical protein JNL12_21125 [Planctomycetes bacterium]|nr:hypothetical protein [Planctomycetota bacterium]
MTKHEPLPGLRPHVPASCRSSLQAHLDAGVAASSSIAPETGPAAEHTAGCASCQRHVQAAGVLAAALRKRPDVPQELASPAFLEQIYERAVAEFEEAGSLVTELARPAVLPSGAEALSGPQGLLSSSVGALVGAEAPQPSAWAWEKIRRSLLAETSLRAEAMRSPVRFTRRRVMLATLTLATTVAATLAVGVYLVGARPPARGPEIRFVELGSAPAVEFAVLRHGIDR